MSHAIFHLNSVFGTSTTINEVCTQTTINCLPNDILRLIFSHVGVESTKWTTLVSHRFLSIVCDRELWRIFYRRLGYPAKVIFSRLDHGYRHNYYKTHNLNSNFQHDQFVIEMPQEENLVPVASSDDLCCYLNHSKFNERTFIVKNVWSKTIEFIITPESPLIELLKEVSFLAGECACFDNTSGFQHQKVVLETLIEELIAKKKKLERFIELDALIHLAITQIERSKKHLYQNIQKECDFLIDCFLKEQEIVDFVANTSYCIVHFHSGIVNIWDRSAKKNLATYCVQENMHLGFVNNHACICLKESKKLLLFSFKKNNFTHIENVELFSSISSTEILILYEGQFTIIDFKNRTQQNIYSTEKTIIDFSYDTMNQILAIVKTSSALFELAFYELKNDKGRYTLLKIKQHFFTAFRTIQCHNGSFLVSSPFSLIKMKIFPDQSVRSFDLWADSQHSTYFYVWEGEKLHVLSSTKKPYVLRTFNFFVTFEQVAKDLIQGYRENTDADVLEMRFLGLAKHHQEGILTHLRHIKNSLGKSTFSWKDALNIRKAEAIESYLATLKDHKKSVSKS